MYQEDNITNFDKEVKKEAKVIESLMKVNKESGVVSNRVEKR